MNDRRRLITEAVVRLSAREGLDAASMRDIAAEAGVSVGMLQHYYKSRDDLLLAACQHLIEQTGARLRARLAALPEPQPPRAILRATFAEMLPLDEVRRSELRVWMAFLARAVVKPDLEAFMRETHQASHASIAAQLRRGQRDGAVSPTLDPDRATIALFGMVEGLVSHVQVGHYSGAEALRAVDDSLDALFIS